MKKKIVTLLCLVIFCADFFAQEVSKFEKLLPMQELRAEEQGNDIFAFNWITDSVVIGTSLALNITALLVKKETVAWDGTILNQDTINSFDRLFVNSYSKPIDIVSTIFEFATMLSPAILMMRPLDDWLIIGTMYAESALLAWGTKEIIKNLYSRNRPYMYNANPPADDIADGDNLMSFPSGHATMAFNGATFLSYVFAKYYPDSDWKIPVIVGSYAGALTTAILRVASGNHFMTDVIAGAVFGTATGFLVPFLHTLKLNDEDDKTQISISPTANSLVFKIAF